MRHKFKKIIDFCLRARCILCGGQGEGNLSLCASCEADLPWLQEACFQCANPLPAGAASDAFKKCGACLNDRPPFFRTIALFQYDDLIAKCMSAFKFQGHLKMGQMMGVLMSRTLPRHYYRDRLPQCIIPVPLHQRRLKARGFNQALELARPLAHALRLPIDIQSCERIKATEVQSLSFSAKTRRQNVKGVFEVVRPFSFKHVAILDDVVTTTATVSQLSCALLESGVQRVDVWCCARTIFSCP